jgi:hypothetical protein
MAPNPTDPPQRSLMAIRVFSLFAMVSFAVATSSARADTEHATNKAAKKACLTGDFRKGAEILAQLYVDTGEPTHLFNQGRCYEQNHQWQEAIDSFREYLRKVTGLTPAERGDTEKHIADCEAFLVKDAAKRAQPETSATVSGHATSSAPPITGDDRSSVAVTTRYPALQNRNGSSLRIAGLVVGGFGLAAMVAGIGFNLKANQLASEVNQHYSQSMASTHSTYTTLGWVGYGVGMAAIAAGATLYAVGWGKGRAQSADSATLALAPLVVPGQASLILQGAF